MVRHPRALGQLRELLLGTAVGTTLISLPAVAEQPTGFEEFRVTGTRIVRAGHYADTPLTTVEGANLRLSGFQSIGETLRQQLAAGGPGLGQSTIINGGGANTINLRYLGPERALVLVNGRRMPSFADELNNEVKDLNFIPTALIDRIEILRDGASTAYGADAVSGVVNVILNDTYEGFNLSLLKGATGEGDAEQLQVSAVGGAKLSQGHITVSLEYRFQDSVAQRERDWAVPTISFMAPGGFNNGSPFDPGGVFLPLGSPAAYAGNDPRIVCSGFNNVPGASAFLGDGTTNLFAGSIANCNFTFGVIAPNPSGISPDTPYAYDYGYVQDILSQQELLGATLLGSYDIADSVEAFVEFQLVNRNSSFTLDGFPGGLFGTPANPFGWVVPSTNPNLASYFTSIGETPVGGLFAIRPTTTIGRRDFDTDTTMTRVVAGLRGDIPTTLLTDFSYEVSYLYAEVDTSLSATGYWNLTRANTISNPAACAADSACSAAVNASGALDTFFPGNWTADEIAYLRTDLLNQSNFTTRSFIAEITGFAFELPAGAVGVALGYEYREESGENIPDPEMQSGENVAGQVLPTDGSFDVHELFAELEIPLIADKPFVEEASLNLQGRVFDYSNFGTDSVWKVGTTYSPVTDILFRATIGTAFRAPTISDLFGGGTVSFDTVTDPCNNWDTALPLTSNTYQNCAADPVVGGIPGFTQAGPNYPVQAGSNRALEPETAETWTVGVVVTPWFAPNLEASVDLWNIAVDDIIFRPTSTSVLTACYAGPVGLTAPECAQFSGRAAGSGTPINFVNRLTNGSGSSEASGLDWSVNYGFSVNAATINLVHQGTYLSVLDFDAGAGRVDQEGGAPRFRANASATMDFSAWSTSWRVRYIGEMRDINHPTTASNDFNYDGPEAHIEHDARVAYRANQATLELGLNNVFDEEPPYVFNVGTNTDALNYGSAVIGRYAFLRLSADF